MADDDIRYVVTNLLSISSILNVLGCNFYELTCAFPGYECLFE